MEAHFAVNFWIRSFWARRLLSCSILEDLRDFNSEFRRRISISRERGSPPPPEDNGGVSGKDQLADGTTSCERMMNARTYPRG